jgi:hypothetical protein
VRRMAGDILLLLPLCWATWQMQLSCNKAAGEESAMPRGRPPEYDQEEDAIILRTVGWPTGRVNELLTESGKKHRTADQLTGRRRTLLRRPEQEASVWERLEWLGKQRDLLRASLADNEERLREVEKELAETLREAGLQSVNGTGA